MEPAAEPATNTSRWSYMPSVGLGAALRRGFMRRCPRCGKGSLFNGYLKMADHCSNCELAFEPYRSDDVPAYFTILIIGHIVVPGLLAVEKIAHPEEWVQMAIWLPVTLFGTLALLPFLKGAVIAAIWRSKQDK